MENEDLTSGQKSWVTKTLKPIKEEAEQILSDLKDKQDEISELYDYLLCDDQEETCLKTQLQVMLHEANDLDSSIKEINAKINCPDAGVLPDIESAKGQIDSILEDASASIKKFSETHTMLYGDGNSVGGLESKFKFLCNESEKLQSQVEGTLAGATNVELAKAFEKQKKSYSAPKIVWTIAFTICVAGMMCMASYIVFIDLGSSENIKGYAYALKLLERLPLFGPLIWFAMFASKQQSQSKRLEEEYAFKEAITKTYVGHKRQIDKLKDSDAKDELVAKLASSTIEAIAFNPSSTLEKQAHNENTPASKLLNKTLFSSDKIADK